MSVLVQVLFVLLTGSFVFSSPKNDLVSFIKDGINYNISPCDDFYDFVCGNHSSNSNDLLKENFFNSIIPSIKEDEKYPELRNAFLKHIDDCAKQRQSPSHKRSVTLEYLRNFGSFPLKNETINSEHNFLESILKIVLISPTTFPYEVLSPVEIGFNFTESTNTLHIYADPKTPTDEKLDSSNPYFIKMTFAWFRYAKLFEVSMESESFKRETQDFLKFLAHFIVLLRANSKYSSIEERKWTDLSNEQLRTAIFHLLPLISEDIDIYQLTVKYPARMFKDGHLDLMEMFHKHKRIAQHFILASALITQTDFLDSTKVVEINEQFQDSAQQCFYETLSDTNSFAIFNLYIVNLMMRKGFPMTSMESRNQVAHMVSMIKFSLGSNLLATSWLKHDNRDIMLRLYQLIFTKVNIGFSSELNNSQSFEKYLKRFQADLSEKSLFDKIVTIRQSNYRLAKEHAVAFENHLKLTAAIKSSGKDIYLPHMILQSPFYHDQFPSSFNFGLLGSTIGHELFHKYDTSTAPLPWILNRHYQHSMVCYKNFFNNICYNLTIESKNDDDIDSQLQLLVSGTRKICADGDTDLNENFADIEGARIAFETMKFENSKIDDFLKKRALSEFDFTNGQMFFIAAAQNYCNKKMNDDSHMAADLQDSDPHGTDKVRVNAMAMQMQEFTDAFSCSTSDAMTTSHEDKCYLLSKN